MVETLRKLCLTSVVTVFSPGMAQLLFGSIISIAACVMQIRLHPFRDPVVQYLQSTLLLLLMVMYVTAGLFVPSDRLRENVNDESWGATIFLSNIAVFIVMSVLMLRAAFLTRRTVGRLRLTYASDNQEVRLYTICSPGHVVPFRHFPTL